MILDLLIVRNAAANSAYYNSERMDSPFFLGASEIFFFWSLIFKQHIPQHNYNPPFLDQSIKTMIF